MHTILKTKLYAPPYSDNCVSRKRLVDLLNHGIERKLTLVSAPAGFGKTTVISEWMKQSTIPFCWLSLDERDNEAERFLSYIVASLQSIKIDIVLQITALTLGQSKDGYEDLLVSIINQIATMDNCFVLTREFESVCYDLIGIRMNMNVHRAHKLDIIDQCFFH